MRDRMPDFDVDKAFAELLQPAHRPTIPDGPSTVADVLERPLAERPDQVFLISRTRRVTYAEFDRMAERAACAFVALGVRPGDRVAMSLPSELDIVAGFHGLLRIGAIWLGINRNLAPPEKRYLIEDAGVSLAVGDPEMAQQFEDIAAEVPDLRRVVVCEAADPDCEWERLLAEAPHSRPEIELDPFQPGGLAYTSGTTGFPKGVVHSHHNLLVPGALQASMGDYAPGAIRGDCFPMTILNMQVLTSLLVAQAGVVQVFMDRIDAQGVAEWIRGEGVTLLTAPPALIYSLAHDDQIPPQDLQSLKRVLFGGGACPQSIIDAFRDKFDVPVQGTYGLTEMPTVTTMDPPDARVGGASGIALPHVRVTIRDEDARELPVGETGEVCVEAVDEGPWAGVYTPMLGYWRRPDATAETVRDGRLHTGDIGKLDEAGNLTIVDRKNLLILRGGANIYPAEIERVLHEDDRVEACAVVGVPDERLGERVAAWVQVAPGKTLEPVELIEHCRERLAKYKVPEKIELIDEMPRNAMNKIVRRELPAIDLSP
jgi:acyl-CoA synthetase (AMP-forming)/AMP-acid ligase II